MLLREVVVRDHPFPVALQGGAGLGVGLAVAQLEGVAAALAGLAGRGVHHLFQQGGRLGLIFPGEVVEHVHDLVVPAALFTAFAVEFAERRPDAEVAVGHRESREFQAPVLETAQDRAPGLLALALPRFAGQQHFLAARPGADDDEQRLGAVVEAGLDVQAVGEGIDDLERREIALLPGGVLDLPLRLETGERAGREGRPLPEQAPQRELEVARGQAVEVEFGQHRAEFLALALKERQHPGLEGFVEAAQPRALNGDRAGGQRQAPRFAVTVTVAAVCAALMPAAPEELGHFRLEQVLEPVLDVGSCERFKGLVANR